MLLRDWRESHLGHLCIRENSFLLKTLDWATNSSNVSHLDYSSINDTPAKCGDKTINPFVQSISVN